MSINKQKLFDPYSVEIEEASEVSEILEYTDVLSTISKTLIEYRKKLNLSQKELADKLEVNQSMISKLESGRYNATLKMLLKISYSLQNNSNFFIELLDKIKNTFMIKYNYNNVRINKKYDYSIELTETGLYNNEKQYKTCNKMEKEIKYKIG